MLLGDGTEYRVQSIECEFNVVLQVYAVGNSDSVALIQDSSDD
jgi:hypothetical protein